MSGFFDDDDYDSKASKGERDAALDRVVLSDEAWHQKGLELVLHIQKGFEDIWEAYGRKLRALGLPKPRNPKAQWGALCNAAVRLGLIAKTGKYGHMRKVSSHSRESKIYRRM